jgi:hypothetical protein
VKDGWRYTFTPLPYLHGMDRKNFMCFIKINLWKRVISFESRCNFGEINCETDCLNSGSSAMATIGLNDAEPQDFATAVRKHCTKFSTIVCSFSAKK